jgi:hypothetical protein
MGRTSGKKLKALKKKKAAEEALEEAEAAEPVTGNSKRKKETLPRQEARLAAKRPRRDGSGAAPKAAAPSLSINEALRLQKQQQDAAKKALGDAKLDARLGAGGAVDTSK